MVTQPAQPVQPAQPMQPAQPVQPAQPAQPAQPGEPGTTPAAPPTDATAAPPADQAQPPTDQPAPAPKIRKRKRAPTAAAPAAAQPTGKPQIKPIPDEEFVEEVVVTGSRIPRVELTTAAPVTVLNRAQIEATGHPSVGEILQNLPEQSNAINTQFNNGGNGATRVNLRGLGTVRTLVLLNGRRHVAGGTGADATVDLNSIPTSAIQSIEILKDGASAVYGSDAISGVVNIITRKDFYGTEASAFTGTSNHGDGTLYDLSLTTGQVTERGNILFNAGYYQQKSVWAGDRDFSKYALAYNFQSRRVSTSGSPTVPNGLISTRGATTGNQTWTDLVARNPTVTSFILDPNGEWRSFDDTAVTDAGGDLYNFQPENYLVTPQQRAHLFATGEYRFSDFVRGFFEASYTNRQSAQKLAPEPLQTAFEGIVVSKDNLYNPFGRDFLDVRRRLIEFGNRDYHQDLDTFRIVTGLQGSLPKGLIPAGNWQWDLSFNHGRTQGVETKQGLLRRSLLQNAVGPSFIDPSTGNPTCGTPTAPIKGCTPLNLFGGEGTITPKMRDYLTYKGTLRGYSQQDALQANLTSDELFRMPGASHPAGLAVGYEFRRESGSYIPDPLTASGDTTGNKEAETSGAFHVNEGYAELSLPVLGPTPWSDGSRDALELSAAARLFNYNTFGTNSTYKLGGRMTLIQDVTVRGTYSTAFRAPAISELYLGQTDTFPQVKDPCSKRTQGTPLDAACDAQDVPDDLSDNRLQLRALRGGNAELKPETANIFTLGLVIQPRFVQDLAITVDYYNMVVRDAIAPVTASVILSSCYPREADVMPQYCDRILRDADGFILDIFDPLSNVGGDTTAGLDFSARYEPQTSFGRLSFTVDGTWLHYFDRLFAGDKIVRAVGTYDLSAVYPSLKTNLGVGWSNDKFRAGLRLRWLNSFKECQANACNVQDPSAPPPLSRPVESYYTLDANFAYNLETGAGTTLLSAGVNNILNRDPARIYNGFLAASDAATYDYMGRYFYVRLSQKF